MAKKAPSKKAKSKPAPKPAKAKAAKPKKVAKAPTLSGQAKKLLSHVKGVVKKAVESPKKGVKAPAKVAPAPKAAKPAPGKALKAPIVAKAKAPIPPAGKEKAKDKKAEAKAPKGKGKQSADELLEIEEDDFGEEFGGEAPATERTREAKTEEAPPEEVILTDAEGRRICRVSDCDQVATVDGYCRYHYLLYWKKIQIRKKILSEGKLENYIEELTARYPDKFLEMLKKDLRTQKDFLAAIQELELDDSGSDEEFEEDDQTYIEEVRGISSEAGAREEDEF